MDDFIDAEIIETLNFLRPPVKRNCKALQRDYIGYVITDSTSQEDNLRNTLRVVKSSLILQKTSKKPAPQKYTQSKKKTSVFQSHTVTTNTPVNKPAIQVTVTPHIDHNNYQLLEANKEAHRRNKRDKIITDYLKESCVLAKNVYLIVAKKKKNKIYEINTLESSNANDQFKDVKKILSIGRMPSNKEKKKHKKFDIRLEEGSRLPDPGCQCQRLSEDDQDEENESGSRKDSDASRVKIVGQIGLNDNDEYVMKCFATINGQKVDGCCDEALQEKTVHGLDMNQNTRPEISSPIRFNLEEENPIRRATQRVFSQSTQINNRYIDDIHFVPKSDRTVQCNLCDLCRLGYNTNTNDDVTNVSNLQGPGNPLVVISVYPKHDTNTMTALASNENRAINRYTMQNYRLAIENDAPRDTYVRNANFYQCCPCDKEKGILKEYKKDVPETDDTNEDEDIKDKIEDAKIKTKFIKTSEKTKTNKKTSRSSSPKIKSPKSMKQESKSTKQESKSKQETKSTKKDLKSTKQESKSTKQESKFESQKEVKTESVAKKENMKKESAKSTKSRTTSPTKPSITVTQQKDVRSPNQAKKLDTATSTPNRVEVKKQSNTTPVLKSKVRESTANAASKQPQFSKPIIIINDNKKTKKATAYNGNSTSNNNVEKNTPKNIIVNKKEDKRASGGSAVTKKNFPKNDISKVSINIDSEKEYYDVVFEKGIEGTDFSLRRTVKENMAQKYFEETFEQHFGNDITSDSLENFLPAPESARNRRSMSQNLDISDVATDFGLPDLTTGLHVKDSIEIGHIREHSRDYRVALDTALDEKSSGEREPKPVVRKSKLSSFPYLSEPLFPVSYNLFQSRMKRYLLGMHVRLYYNVANHQPSCSQAQMANNTQNNITSNQKRDEEKSITDDEKQGLKKLERAARIKKRNVNLQARVKIPVTMKQESTQFNYRLMLSETNRHHNHFIDEEKEDLRIDDDEINEDPEDFLTRAMNYPQECKMRPCQDRKVIKLTKEQYRRVKRSIYKVSVYRKIERKFWNSSLISLGSVKSKRKSQYIMYWNKEVQTDQSSKAYTNLKMKESRSDGHNHVTSSKKESKKKGHSHKVHTKESDKNYKCDDVRKIASSVVIRYATVYHHRERGAERSYEYYESNLMKHKKRDESIVTLFRGHRKPRTPNLGTSFLTLPSEDKQPFKSSPELKGKKPFLRRLMSCLVVRSQTTDGLPRIKAKATTRNSSIDSYHISTSLGAIEMSSSMYDTSASFYSNHTINNKAKRGFLSSVRGFLTSKITDGVLTSRKN